MKGVVLIHDVYLVYVHFFLLTNFNVHIHRNTNVCYPHIMFGTSESEYKVALIVQQEKKHLDTERIASQDVCM